MPLRPNCSACEFVSAHLGPGTPCPWHAGEGFVAVSQDDHPWTSPSVHPTVDRPYPFTRHELARLLVLRSRYQEQRDRAA